MPPPWQISIDTGGTFSDCIATAPDGTTRRAKILSHGALRARILEVLPPNSIRIHESWRAPDGLVQGWRLHPLARPACTPSRVAAHHRDQTSTILELSTPLSLSPGDAIELRSPEESPIIGVRLLTQTPADQPLPEIQLRLATTRGTNALLERRAGPVAFFVTQGFADLLDIGTQQRPDIFALTITKPRPLYDIVIEVPERLSVDGSVLRPLDLATLTAPLAQCQSKGIRSAAIALMHSWINPAHEEALSQLLRASGFDHISCSHEMAAAIKFLPRAQTAVVDAYLAPVIKSYLGNVAGALSPGSTVHAMTSSGGLVSSADFRPKDSLLSGPAGGVVGAAAAARRSGFTKLISFDMGGTSTDVARYDNDHTYVFEHHVGDAHIVAPAVAVESVAAGGGSICWFDQVEAALRVGPHSAGAAPGPACYGAGGPLTITDANLLLGRLSPERFEIPISIEAARAKAEELLAQVQQARDEKLDLYSLLEGLIDLADERMAQAIRTISIAKGYDPKDHILVAFGGAGGQHACAVAQRLGMTKVLIPQDVGLLSAKGLSQAAIERFAQRQVLQDLATALPTLHTILTQLESESRAAVEAQGITPDNITIRRRLIHLRLKGQDTSLPIEISTNTPTKSTLESAFNTEYQSLYGYPPTNRAIEVESVRVIASSVVDVHRATDRALSDLPTNSAAPEHGRCEHQEPPDPAQRHTQSHFNSQPTQTTLYTRADLHPHQQLQGPSLILEPHATTILPPNWTATVDRAGALLLTSSPHRPPASSSSVHQELLTSRLIAIATDMGETLRATALSTNVKERLDFSCAILDADAQLVINAPHIPVHLGALGLSVRQVRDAIEMEEGDVVVTNHPAFGGSHLPDITVITPVFRQSKLIAYVASRAHHAEIGGTRPGSMPPGATTLAEEGVVIPPMHLVKAGVSKLEDFRRLITTAPHPTRQPDDNLADIQAQIAANHRGAAAITQMCHDHASLWTHGRANTIAPDSTADLARTMSALTDRAHQRTLAALQRFAGQTLRATESLDDGFPIQVTIAVAQDGRANIDFTGSAPTHSHNFNTPRGVIRSAVMYVLRLLINQPLPLNEGILRAIDLTIPEGMLNPRFDADPTRCPAVAAGNCETSQRVVDTLLKAFGIAACSQGTMNNLIFGNARFGYYETICGGSGATSTAPGADAVHTHMTNTRITDPEVLEQRFPVRLERFAIRPNSGGPGQHRGGHGAIREYTFLEPVSISLITQHRTTAPYGTNGGRPGQPGRQLLHIPSYQPRELSSVEALDVPAGTKLTIHTPGGGGCGIPS